MILNENINLLKKINPYIFDNLNKYIKEENKSFVNLEEAKNGEKTLSLSIGDKTSYLHSKYNPIKEAETIFETYKNSIENNETIIFYGSGLGYHIEFILKNFKNIKYYIYDPIPQILYEFLSNTSIKNYNDNMLMGINYDSEEFLKEIKKLRDFKLDKIKIIELPSHKNIFIDEYKTFREILVKSLESDKISIGTEYIFQKRWLINSMKNFKYVLSTPNVIIEKKSKFKGKTAILVSAGPSLNEEIENLKYIKENGLAYIFSVGSAINTLIHNDIYPHAVCTYDPRPTNRGVFKSVINKNISEIPMIFGSSVGNETLTDYPGKLYHMITFQDSIGNFYLKSENNTDIDIIYDAPSIAVITLQLLYLLGFSDIILVGQNLAYKGKERYAEGILYRREVSDKEIESGIWVKDVKGQDVLTNKSFNTMRFQMESYIKQMTTINVINSTKDGAHIEGTKFIELKEIICNQLKEKVVEKDWLEGNCISYDKEYLKSKSRKMDIEYKNALKINKEYNNILDKTEKTLSSNKIRDLENLYVKLDKQLRKLENNEFYKNIILPMNRLDYKIFVDSIDDLNNIVDEYDRGKRILDNFRTFINICIKDIETVYPIYMEMKNYIDEYCNINI